MTTILETLFFTKHLLADFIFQTVYMLGKSKSGTAWIMPLSAHCAVHAGMSLGIILMFSPQHFWLAGVEFVAHFIIDRIKATYKLPAGVWAPEEKGKYLSMYYMAFGIDQYFHALTYISMIAVIKLA